MTRSHTAAKQAPAAGSSIRAEFQVVLRRDLLCLLRRPGGIMQPLVLFLIICILFPLGANPATPSLIELAPAIIWVGVLLALLSGIEPLIRTDLQDGTLDRLLTAPAPLSVLAIAKALTAVLVLALPLVLLGPLVALGFGLSLPAAAVLALTLSLGAPTLCLLGLAGSALVAGLPRGGLLLPLLLLPLLVPVLIFACGAVRAAQMGLPVVPAVKMLAALMLLAASLGPLAIAAALRLRGQAG